MIVREAKAKTVEEYAAEVRSRGKGTFQSKELRDEVVKLVGGTKSTLRAQNMHPEYVTDYVGRIESGFPNSQYDTYWPVLYLINGG